MSATTRVGVAGWSYPDWEGIVYPRPAPSRFDPLAFLAGYFDTVEINSPFYRTPSPKTVSSWVRRASTNPEFRFTSKLYRGFTHDRSAGPEDEHAFKKALAPMMDAGLLGALLVQFPWSFKNIPDDRAYLHSLLERFRGYPLVVEVRHASWNEPELYTYLAEHGVGFCNIDQPRIGRSLGPSDKATSPVGYIRLHGRNYRDWFRQDAGRDARYDYLYSEDELDPWVEKIEEVAEQASETFVVTNNHFRGQAVVNALQIRSKLSGKKVKSPRFLAEQYPVLQNFVEADEPAQGKLF